MEQLTLFEQRPMTASKVYIGARSGFIKIGLTRDVERRARELGIRILWTAPGDRSDERKLHRRFAQARLDREWFLSAPDILSFVAQAA